MQLPKGFNVYGVTHEGERVLLGAAWSMSNATFLANAEARTDPGLLETYVENEQGEVVYTS